MSKYRFCGSDINNQALISTDWYRLPNFPGEHMVDRLPCALNPQGGHEPSMYGLVFP